MKKVILCIGLIAVAIFTSRAQGTKYEVKIVTCIESIVPNGVGWSRLIVTDEKKNYKDFSSIQMADKKEHNKSKRGEIRVENFEETKLLNFYNE